MKRQSPGDAFASLGLCRLVPEIKKGLRAYLKHLAELEHNVERNADVAKLDGADMAPVNIDKLRKLKLLPVELGFGKKRSVGGWPAPDAHSGILERLAEMSLPYGTKIEIGSDGTGTVLL